MACSLQKENHLGGGGGGGVFMQSFLDAEPEQIQTVVTTNLMGSLLCTRAALRRMAGQKRGGHIFMMDGAGADGLPTPQYAAYGATKAGIAHLMGSLQVSSFQMWSCLEL